MEKAAEKMFEGANYFLVEKKGCPNSRFVHHTMIMYRYPSLELELEESVPSDSIENSFG